MPVDIIGKMKPKNNQPFALVDACDVEMPNGKRLDAWREGIRLQEVNVQVDEITEGKDFQAVCYGNGLFVAIDGNRNAAYSTDGITWLSTEMPGYENWTSVAYGGGVFVAVSEGDSTRGSRDFAYSTDGVNWQYANATSYAVEERDYKCVAYGNGTFVAVAYNTADAAYSRDGITWLPAVMPSSHYWSSVTYGEDRFIAIANGGTKAAYSTDGIHWTEFTLSALSNGVSIAYGDGKFVAIDGVTIEGALGYGDDSVAYGADHTSFNSSSLPDKAFWRSIAYGNGMFVAVASGKYGVSPYSSDIAAYSKDGINWISTVMPVSAAWRSVTYGDGLFVAVSESGTTAPGIAAYSTDGINWYFKTETRLFQDGQDVTDEVRELLGGADDPGADDPEAEATIPTFNLVERGLPAVSMDGSEAEAAMETEDIIAAAESGAVKFVIGIDMGGSTIPFEAIMNSLRSSAAEVCAFASAFDVTGVPMTVTLMMTPEGCVAYITNLAKAVAAPTAIDLSAFATEGKIVESYADGTSKTTTIEFDEQGNPTKITDGDGNVTEIVW